MALARWQQTIVDTQGNIQPGGITTSGFTRRTGDDFTTTTTNAHKFLCYITVANANSLLNVGALQ
jgi:hypothetical protein